MNRNQSKAGHFFAFRATEVARYANSVYKINTCAETLPNFIKKKAPRKGREKEVQTQKKRARPHGGNEITKNPTFHQSHQAYQLNPIKLQVEKNPSLQ
jgi:hypothetical protein